MAAGKPERYEAGEEIRARFSERGTVTNWSQAVTASFYFVTTDF